MVDTELVINGMRRLIEQHRSLRAELGRQHVEFTDIASKNPRAEPVIVYYINTVLEKYLFDDPPATETGLLGLYRDYDRLGKVLNFTGERPVLDGQVLWVERVEHDFTTKGVARVSRVMETGEVVARDYELRSEPNHLLTGLQSRVEVGVDETVPAEVYLFILDRGGALCPSPYFEDKQLKVAFDDERPFVKTVLWGSWEWEVHPQGTVTRTGALQLDPDGAAVVSSLPVVEAWDLSPYLLSDPVEVVKTFKRQVPMVAREGELLSSFPSVELPASGVTTHLFERS